MGMGASSEIAAWEGAGGAGLDDGWVRDRLSLLPHGKPKAMGRHLHNLEDRYNVLVPPSPERSWQEKPHHQELQSRRQGPPGPTKTSNAPISALLENFKQPRVTEQGRTHRRFPQEKTREATSAPSQSHPAFPIHHQHLVMTTGLNGHKETLKQPASARPSRQTGSGGSTGLPFSFHLP